MTNLTNTANGFSPFFVICGVNFLIPARGDLFCHVSVIEAAMDSCIEIEYSTHDASEMAIS